MTKRTFLELASGLLAWPALSPLAAWASGARLKNWAENLEYGTDQLHAARSLHEVQEFVRKRARLKVLGTRHCFNTIADSRHGFLSLAEMGDVVALDAAARTVTVQAGLRYGALCPYLEEKGFALHNLASLPHIGVAGACSTGTHGSGEKNGNLSSAVVGLELVTAAGELVRLSADRDGEAFRGAVVGLGALGVVTKLTLEVQPTFAMRQWVYEDLPLAEMKDHFDAIFASGYSVSLFTDWQGQKLREVWIKDRTRRGSGLRGAGRALRGQARDEEPPPDRRAARGELHRAAGDAGSLVRAAAAFPDGLHAERRPGAPVGVLRAPRARRRGDPGAGAAA